MDAELPFSPTRTIPAPRLIAPQIERPSPATRFSHCRMKRSSPTVDEAGKLFHILVLKTNMTIPYTSVFIRLDCKYLSADAEKRLRAKMAAAAAGPHPSLRRWPPDAWPA